jgi:methylmalonyl-CoA epimerase
MQVDHIGIVVRDLEAAVPYYRDRLGMALVGREEQPRAGVRVAYFDAGTTRIQLLQPTAPGPISGFLAEYGEGLHHICLLVEDIQAAVATLAPDAGVAIGIGGFGRRTCFLPVTTSGLRVELAEHAPRQAEASV